MMFRAILYVFIGLAGTWMASDMLLAGILSAVHGALATGPALVALNSLIAIGLCWLPVFAPLQRRRGTIR